ncbi:hypothetical protein ACH42_02850 [Endozoicomonas sp. (ex Bugula neritina AB1)]|nr:hypothetical protein ACH42_02850 [Endozoicomonas sp. (ex Bugula neritina AB1)]
MPFINFSQQAWRPRAIESRFFTDDIPEPYREWLLDSGSLTRRLKSICTKSFKVKLLQQVWGAPSDSEQQFLQCRGERASIREVLLMVDDRPVVFARSVLPESSLTGKNKELLQLGEEPLGDFLFSQPSLVRGQIEIEELPANQFNAHLERPYHQERAWGRRSLFYLNEKAISVCEVFLPEHNMDYM